MKREWQMRALALAKGGGGHACELPKLLSQVTMAAKTAVEGNVDNGPIALL